MPFILVCVSQNNVTVNGKTPERYLPITFIFYVIGVMILFPDFIRVDTLYYIKKIYFYTPSRLEILPFIL